MCRMYLWWNKESSRYTVMFESCVNMFEHANYVSVNMVNVKWRYKLAFHIYSMNKLPRVKKLVSRNKLGPVACLDKQVLVNKLVSRMRSCWVHGHGQGQTEGQTE